MYSEFVHEPAHDCPDHSLARQAPAHACRVPTFCCCCDADVVDADLEVDVGSPTLQGLEERRDPRTELDHPNMHLNALPPHLRFGEDLNNRCRFLRHMMKMLLNMGSLVVGTSPLQTGIQTGVADEDQFIEVELLSRVATESDAIPQSDDEPHSGRRTHTCRFLSMNGKKQTRARTQPVRMLLV